MRLLCVVPARVASTRLPHKPLRLLAGEPLICVVVRHVLELGVDAEVVVATDDQRVVEAVAPLGVVGILTSPLHGSGTERTAEVARLPQFSDVQVVLNVQGDQPFVSSVAVHGALDQIDRGYPIGTTGASLTAAARRDRNRVKVVVDGSGHALAFSREDPGAVVWPHQVDVLHHIGIYAYRHSALLRWTSLPPVPGERVLGLEQLRPLAHGMAIGVARIHGAELPAIDTEEDLHDAEALVR